MTQTRRQEEAAACVALSHVRTDGGLPQRPARLVLRDVETQDVILVTWGVDGEVQSVLVREGSEP